VHVSLGYGIIENEYRVTGKSKIPQVCKNGDLGRQGIHKRLFGDRVI
jgi:hypothetical protein